LRKLAPILFIAIILGSCGPKAIYSKSINLNGAWTYPEQLITTIDIADTIQKYDLVATIDHGEDFGYENLYLQITTIFPDGEKRSSPLSLELANSKGFWNGKCSGNACTLSFNLQEDFRFKEPGSYSFEIEQFSRKDTLKGLNEMTLSLYEVEAE